MDAADKRMLEREALRNMIQQWNANRLDLFELSEPNENLEFHGVMRFYFQDSGQKIATKCIRVASDATVSDVIETLIEKFRPDMRMLSLGSYSLWETHAPTDERRLEAHEKPLLVQLNWHADDREGRFLLKCTTDGEIPLGSNTEKSDQNFKRKLSKREKKELKKREKLSRMKSDATNDENKPVAEKLYTELPETSFTRSISNPEAVMRRRRQQKLERKLQQFRSKDGGPDTGGTLKIYGSSLCVDVPYKTLLLSVGDTAAAVVREMLDKYGLSRHDPHQYCIVQVNTADNSEYILEDDDCPLAIVMTHPHRGSIMFHVRRRPADSQPRRRKKKVGATAGGAGGGGGRPGSEPLLVETSPDGTPLENGRRIRLNDVLEVGSGNGMSLQLYGPSIQPRHCVLAAADGAFCVTPLHADAHVQLNGQRVYHTTRIQHGSIIKFGRVSTFRFVDPLQENILNRNLSQSQHFGSGSLYDRSPTSPGPDNGSGAMSPTSANSLSTAVNSPTDATLDTTNANTTNNTDYQRTMSPISTNTNNQDNYSYKDEAITPYNNNTLKLENESLMMTQHLNESKEDLIREDNMGSAYSGQDHEQNSTLSRTANSQFKDNYETTFDLDGNVETKSICSAKSGGSGHDNRCAVPASARPGQEAILPAVLEFPEPGQVHFLNAVITRLDPHAPAFKLAPVYTLYLCARYRASTHYRPELTPTERAHKLTALLHHVATLIHATVQEKYAESAAQAFWMANSSELLHFLKCDRHISTFSTQAQELLTTTVQNSFSNLVSCFQEELGAGLSALTARTATEPAEAAAPALQALAAAMVLLRRCRVNAALTIQLFSHLFHYINAVCFNKLVTEPGAVSARWGATMAARLALLAAWAERQGLEFAADCHLARVHQAHRLIQAELRNPEEVRAALSACFKLNSVQVHALLSPLQPAPELLELAVQHACALADQLYRADAREITLEESPWLGVGLLIPGDGFSAEVVRGVPPGLAEFLAPLQRAGLCRLAHQPHALGVWSVYMSGYQAQTARRPRHPRVQLIQLNKNTSGMGLSIVAAKGAGQSRLGIYIKSVVAGGPAAADGRLAAGDQLLSVDGHSLVGITQEKAAEYLMRTGPTVTLEVAKQGAVLHGLATLLHQPTPPQNSRQADTVEYEDPWRRNSGTFTNLHPALLRRVRPEDELITTTGQRRCYSRYFQPKEESQSSSEESDDCQPHYHGSIPRLTFTLDRENNQLYEDRSPDTPGCPLEFNCPGPGRPPPRPIPVFTFTCEDFDDIHKSDQQNFNVNQSEPTDYETPPYVPEPPRNYEQSSDSGDNHQVTPLPPQMAPINPKLKLDLYNTCAPERCYSPRLIPECASACDCCRTPQPESTHIPYIDEADSDPVIFELYTCDQDVSTPKIRRILPSMSIDRSEESSEGKPTTVSTSDAICQTPSSPLHLSDDALCPLPEYTRLTDDPSSSTDLKDDRVLDGMQSRLKRAIFNLSRFSSKSDETEPPSTYSTSDSCNASNGASAPKVPPKSTGTKQVLDSTNRKSWKSPDEFRPSVGKVKALTKHFDNINLTYSVKVYKRNCQSSPNLSIRGAKPFASLPVQDKLPVSASLADIKFEVDKAESLETSKKLSDEEAKSIIIQLEDWSRYGSRGSEDTLAQGNEFELPNLPSEERVDGKDSRTPGLLFNEIIDKKPKRITLDNIKIKSNQSSTASENTYEHTPPAINEQALKEYGSLEKLTGLSVPRVVAMVPRKHVSLSDVAEQDCLGDECEGKEGRRQWYGTSVMQSCPNLLKSSSGRRCCVGGNAHHSCPELLPLLQALPVSAEPFSGRRASERDLPARLAAEPVKPSKSTPALHQVTSPPPGLNNSQPLPHRGVGGTVNGGSVGSVPAAAAAPAPAWSSGKSRSSHNLHAAHAPHHDLYQNLSTVQAHALNDRWSSLRSSTGGGSRPQSAHFSPAQPDAHPAPAPGSPPDNHYPQATHGSTMSVRAAKLAEMSEEVTRRQIHQQHQQQQQHQIQQQQIQQHQQQLHQQQQQQQQLQQQQQQQLQQQQQQQLQQQQQQQLQQQHIHQQQMQQHHQQQMQHQMQMQQQMPQQQQQQRYEWQPPGPPSPQRHQPPVAPKPQGARRSELESEVHSPPPQLSTLEPDEESYIASALEPPALSVYPAGGGGSPRGSAGAPSSNPWAREEREREAEARRAAARARRDANIAALLALGAQRTQHQNQQLRALQLERDFERRATQHSQEENGNGNGNGMVMGVSSSVVSSVQAVSVASSRADKEEPPPNHSANTNDANPPPTLPKSILKTQRQDVTPPMSSTDALVTSAEEVNTRINNIAGSLSALGVADAPPPPPERGSSFAVMSAVRHAALSPLSPPRAPATPPPIARDKRVSFHEHAPTPPAPPTSLPPPLHDDDEPMMIPQRREDPDRFIEEAESMLASPTTPTTPNAPGIASHTPGVIGAQEVYRDPRQRRLAEQQRAAAAAAAGSAPAVPEQLSFKEKMKMFALESGEPNTPKDKVKISRAQRDIDAVH